MLGSPRKEATTHAPNHIFLCMQELQFLEACLDGDSDRVQSLLELGVDINIKTPVCENHYYIYYDHRLTGREYYQNYVLP